MAGKLGVFLKSVLGLREVQNEVAMTGQELMNLRATFLFTAFGGMALAQIIRTITDRFEEMREQMVDTWSEIEYQATAVSTILTGTGEVASDVSEKMMELGRETEWTARDAGDAMENLARAGLDLDETIGSVRSVMNLATASGMELAETSRFIAGAYRGWNLEAEETANVQQNVSMVSAEVAHAARNSRQEVDELADAFKYATATARTIGWSMEELTAGLMISADSMINAGMAGRSFRRVMSRMGKIAGTVSSGIDASREAVDELGIELKDAQGDLIGFEELIRRLESATEELSTTQKVNLYQQIAGMRGMNALSNAVRKGADNIAELKLQLKSSAALQALYTEHGKEARDMMEEIHDTVSKQTAGMEGNLQITGQLMDEYDLSAEAAMKLNDVLDETRGNYDKFNEVLKESTIVSEMARERLKTLEGAQILLKSSIEAMWAELARGAFAEVMTWLTIKLRSLTDLISKMPGSLKSMVGFIVLFMSALGRTLPQLFMFIAMINIQQAALASLRLEMYEMAKARLQSGNLAMFEQEQIKNVTYQTMQEVGVDNLSKTMKEAKAMSLQKLLPLIYQEDRQLYSLIQTKILNAQQDAIQLGLNESLKVSTQQLTYLYKQQGVALRGISMAMAPLILQMIMLTAGMGLLMHGFYKGDEAMTAFGTGLIGLMVTMKAYKYVALEVEISTWNAVKAFGSFVAITAATYFILTKFNKTGKIAASIIMLIAGATAVWFGVIKATNVSLGGLITAIGLIANAIIIITDLIWNWTDGITKADHELTGNTLLDSLLLVADALKIVADSVKWVVDLFADFFDMIASVGDKFDWFANLSDDLMGHSVIPENFERGVSRIKGAMGGLRDEMDLGIAKGFGKRQSKFMTAKPKFELDMSNFTTKKEMEPEELRNLVDQGISEALRKWDRQMRRA